MVFVVGALARGVFWLVVVSSCLAVVALRVGGFGRWFPWLVVLWAVVFYLMIVFVAVEVWLWLFSSCGVVFREMLGGWVFSSCGGLWCLV